ncbi:penicillin-binding transpeptidase domain-containing protein [Sporomusa termitida]|uniref:beta-lactamase n=1 Tax=Sporomusa termitida TaxID=2377 RepID=A0A517E1D5_9FIRM|nr:penicillin-binding transpeptidase domain-containing protein [Sporomusa termitida]QDR83415.1 putative beta-lactamase YbxI [Sporomusa termitida]
MKRVFLALFAVALFFLSATASVNAANFVERRDFEKYAPGITGTFIMYDEAQDQYTVFNEPQSTIRLSPCSTFKIYNSLIGLETGVLDIEDVYTLFPWNGKKYSFPAWNRDQTLAAATRDSVVWYFQELASRIGDKRMQDYLDTIEYGNRDISGGLTTFWLRSSLQISAREQVELLRRLYAGTLPFSPDNIEVVKRNITVSENNGIRLLGKTGSGLEDGEQKLGWFVGCVEKPGNRYFFAVNIQAPDGATGGKAREISKAILKDLGIL